MNTSFWGFDPKEIKSKQIDKKLYVNYYNCESNINIIWRVMYKKLYVNYYNSKSNINIIWGLTLISYEKFDHYIIN